MHTVGNKISARERELAPRYYYKIEQSKTCVEKIKAFFRTLLTFMFTQVGVVVLVVTYMIIGALIFEHLEGESQMEVAVEALEVGKIFTFHNLHNHMFQNHLTLHLSQAIRETLHSCSDLKLV